MHVWIFQTGEPVHVDNGDFRPMRAMNLANVLVERGHSVTLWTSAFNHQEKIHRSKYYDCHNINCNLEIKLIPSPGYKQNLSFRRLYDHFILAKNLRKILFSEMDRKPDVAFVGYPPIEVASVFAGWLKVKKVPFLIDVKDQWPTIFILRFPRILRPLAFIFFSPYHFLARRTLKKANGISSISAPFLDWSVAFAGRKLHVHDLVAPLTTPKVEVGEVNSEASLDFWKSKGIDLEIAEPKFCFAGSLSTAFDFQTIIETARKFKGNKRKGKFIICGDGAERTFFQNQTSDLDNIFFPGWVSNSELKILFRYTCASIAPYRNFEDFKKSVPNKIIDALANELPILTSLSGEVRNLVERSEVGFFYEGATDLYEKCVILADDNVTAHSMKLKAAKCYQSIFDFQSVYSRLTLTMENLHARN
jgi:glycosyltransferase involved in cell wall biosynthesis